MRFRELRLALGLVMVGLISPSMGCGMFGDCYTTRHHELDIATPADIQMQFRIDRCAIDVDACTEVCKLAMEREGMATDIGECDVEIGETITHVDVKFDEFTGGPSCSGGGGDDVVVDDAPPPSPRVGGNS
jgi:hypothetical protein